MKKKKINNEIKENLEVIRKSQETIKKLLISQRNSTKPLRTAFGQKLSKSRNFGPH